MDKNLDSALRETNNCPSFCNNPVRPMLDKDKPLLTGGKSYYPGAALQRLEECQTYITLSVGCVYTSFARL